tara:strand:- start:71 stop:493 length:423 start_codon:yes stop_codon:yes gene_type:complete
MDGCAAFAAEAVPTIKYPFTTFAAEAAPTINYPFTTFAAESAPAINHPFTIFASEAAPAINRSFRITLHNTLRLQATPTPGTSNAITSAFSVSFKLAPLEFGQIFLENHHARCLTSPLESCQLPAVLLPAVVCTGNATDF